VRFDKDVPSIASYRRVRTSNVFEDCRLTCGLSLPTAVMGTPLPISSLAVLNLRMHEVLVF
jgi:hypothetical protein